MKGFAVNGNTDDSMCSVFVCVFVYQCQCVSGRRHANHAKVPHAVKYVKARKNQTNETK